jgi:hypothetical protein
MTTFENGPAHGARLMLRRSPYFLRVTYDGKDYDALDQLEDVAKPEETIYVYRITELPGHCHIRAAKGAGGFYSMGKYEFVSPQPDDANVRDNEAWRKWVSEQTEDTKRWAQMLADAADKK